MCSIKEGGGLMGDNGESKDPKTQKGIEQRTQTHSCKQG